jgi:hypothetical protein
MRTTFEIRSKLETAAAASGRSLAQEAEFRIERSFEREGLLEEVLTLTCGPEFAKVFTELLEKRRLAFRDADKAKVHKDLEMLLDLLPSAKQ